MSTPSTPATMDLSGTLMWLPHERCISGVRLNDEHKGACNHPVVILLDQPCENGVVAVATITSFCGKDLTERHNEVIRDKYMPIHPAPRHPDTDRVLCLRGDRALDKRSYVNLGVLHFVSLSDLQPFVTASDPLLGPLRFTDVSAVEAVIGVVERAIASLQFEILCRTSSPLAASYSPPLSSSPWTPPPPAYDYYGQVPAYDPALGYQSEPVPNYDNGYFLY
ncbi:hypothetical protein OQA88_13589 [Cercophora sp. LCS_1]